MRCTGAPSNALLSKVHVTRQATAQSGLFFKFLSGEIYSFNVSLLSTCLIHLCSAFIHSEKYNFEKKVLLCFDNYLSVFKRTVF